MGRNVEELEIRTMTSGTVEVEQLSEKIKKLGKDAKKTGDTVDDMGESSEELSEDLKKLCDEVIKSTEENNKNALSLGSMIKKVVGFGVAVGFVKKATNVFISFDDEMRKVGATVGANAEQMALLRNQAKDLGATTTWSATESAEAQFEFAKAGFSVNEILKATPSILNTAKVGQLSLAEATSITSGTLRMFKLEAEESQRVGDVLAKTASSTSTDMHGLGESLKYAGLEASSMGLSLEETMAVLGTLGNMKIDASQAGTGLRRVFATLQEKAKQQKLIEIGVQLTEDGNFRNFLDIMDDVKAKTKDMADAQKESFLTDVFGAEGKLVMKALIETDEAQFDTLLENLQATEGYAERVSEMMSGGLGGAMLGLQSAIAGVGISLIDNLEPAIIAITGGITSAVRAFNAFLEDLNAGETYAVVLTAVIGGLTAGIGAYKAMMLLTAGVTKALAFAEATRNGIIKTVTMTQAGLTIATQLLTGQMTLAQLATYGLTGALAILAAPVSLIVGAIVALGVGFTVLYKKSETFRNAIAPLINGLKALWSWVKKFTIIDDIFTGVKNLVGLGDDEEEVKNASTATEGPSIPGGNSQEISSSPGVNTDYLLGGGSSGVSVATGGGRAGVGATGATSFTHNGYYLKGTPGGNTKKTTPANAQSSGENTAPVTPEKSIEEKILDALNSIRALLEKKSSSKQVNVTVNKTDTEEIIEQVVTDLTLALSNS